jgi:hypothetical protein
VPSRFAAKGFAGASPEIGAGIAKARDAREEARREDGMKDKGMRPHRVAAWGLGAVGAVLLLTVIGTLVLGPRVRSAKRTADRWRDTLPARSMQLLMNPATRVAEARRLGQARDVTAVAVLAQLSRDGDAEFRRACV